MYLIRRSAFRVLSKPVTPLIAKPRSISNIAPAISRIQQQWPKPLLQRRSYSDEAAKPLDTSVDTPAATSVETSVESSMPKASNPETYNAPSASNSRLYVGNLFFDVTEDALRNIFSKFGSIKASKLVYDNRGLSRGFAFIEYENAEDARAAVANLNEQIFAGRRMVVQIHTPRQHTRRDLAIPTTPNPPYKTLFIGNMSFEMSDKDLNDLFREIQGVLDVRVAMDRRTGQPRGFAHADFISVAEATKAKEILQGKEFYGRRLRVDYGKDVRGSRQQGRVEPEEP